MSSGSIQGGLPFQINQSSLGMPSGTNNPTPAPGSPTLSTQPNNNYNQYAATLFGSQGMSSPTMGANMPTINSWTGHSTTPPSLSQQFAPLPNTQPYAGISQQAGGNNQQTTGMSLGQQMSGASPAPTPGPVAPQPPGGIQAPFQAPIIGNPVQITPIQSIMTPTGNPGQLQGGNLDGITTAW
jgi:hypothetical protein